MSGPSEKTTPEDVAQPEGSEAPEVRGLSPEAGADEQARVRHNSAVHVRLTRVP